MSAAIGTIIRTETVAVKLSNDLSRGEESRGYRDEQGGKTARLPVQSPSPGRFTIRWYSGFVSGGKCGCCSSEILISGLM
jgi:hypothetical protein